jgi:hypothetical protein
MLKVNLRRLLVNSLQSLAKTVEDEISVKRQSAQRLI